MKLTQVEYAGNIDDNTGWKITINFLDRPGDNWVMISYDRGITILGLTMMM